MLPRTPRQGWTCFMSKGKAMPVAARGHHGCGTVAHRESNDTKGLHLRWAREGWYCPVWCQGQSPVLEVFPNLFVL